jgi:hypothetical protein
MYDKLQFVVYVLKNSDSSSDKLKFVVLFVMSNELYQGLDLAMRSAPGAVATGLPFW